MTFTIDLTRREPGCVGHPLMRLNRVMKEAKDKDSVEVIFNQSEIPEKAIQYFRNLFCYILDTPRSRRFSLHAFPVEA